MVKYIIGRCKQRPQLKGEWDGVAWGDVEEIEIANFLPESSDHRPRTRAKLLYDADRIYGIFDVQDKYVRCVHTEFQGPVSRDSCVEFFVQPKPEGGYFNFEFNCGGNMLVSHMLDWTRNGDKFARRIKVTPEDAAQVERYHTMPMVVDPEIQEDTNWRLEFTIPFALLARYAGPLGDIAGQEWRANLYKCGDETSHPHWACWSPVDDLNFHLPHCFGAIRFDG